MPAPALLVVGDGPIGVAARAEAVRLGLDVLAVPTDALVMVEADGTVVCEAGGRLEALRPVHLLLAAEPEPRLLPIPGWILPGVFTLAAAVPTPGEAVWVAGPGALLEEAACLFPTAGRLDLAVVTGLRALGEDRLRTIAF